MNPTSIREIIGRYRFTAIGIVAGLLTVILILDFHSQARREPQFETRVFFTSDDGATLFADDVQKIPPFDHEGHEAVRAYVFSCDDGAHQWVQYLEKWSDEGKQFSQRGRGALSPGAARDLNWNPKIVRRPGAADWIPINDPRATAIMEPNAPPGMGSGLPVMVVPK